MNLGMELIETETDDPEFERFIVMLDGIYGYDFSNYQSQSFRWRVHGLMSKIGIKRLDSLTAAMRYDPRLFQAILSSLTITATEMFRKPDTYRFMRDEVFPHLETYARLKIWHAGCATGEEVYSLAILLREAGLLERSTIYATDINLEALAKAKKGQFALSNMRLFTANYFAAGGKSQLSDYYKVPYYVAQFDESLRRNIVFSDHNLVSGATFGEMELILCRNVMIYFNAPLKDRVVNLFRNSLSRNCFLWLGGTESLFNSAHAHEFEPYSRKYRVYRRKS